MNSSTGGPIVEFTHVTHAYSPGVYALCEIDLCVQEGERVGLIGPSGAGKSTLLRAINGLVIPTEGQLRVLGQDVRALSEAGKMQLRRQIGMIFQEFALIERLSVLTNVLVGRLGYVRTLPSLFRIFPAEDVRTALQALEDVGLQEYAERLVRQLSGGQKQRVGIARALVQEPRLILGDEPTANLDIRTADEILSLLLQLSNQRGATLFLSLHDVRAARRFCTRILALKAGRIVWDGPAAEFGEAQLERVFY
jgi:phosphonate transport system ATP-binding protein